ncbi:uncharacterized protein LOC143348716 [Colletes latitarsis]|uniref:uncharacterized protein LOC143348716 n=1 Tax=Colletes latitarsis TaxID=2605962 RepID=UPI0040362ABB
MEDKGNSGGTAVESVESNASPAKKSTPKGKSIRSQRTKSSHPPTSEMVTSAIRELKDRKGSSLQAIKKYMASTYKVDGEKLAPFIKRYLKSAVTSGAVVQTKGKGASGSFKLPMTKGTETKARVQRTAVKVAEPKKVKKSVEKKTTPVRKPAAVKKSSPIKKAETAKKPAAAKKPSKAAEKTEKAKPASEPKSMSKSKKTVKAPAAKTRTPKPKKAAPKVVKAAAKK